MDGARIGVRFIGHATVLLELDGLRILTDPFLRARLGPLERHGPVPDPESIGRVDVVLVSHGHPDHFDGRSLAALRGRPAVVVPQRLGAHVRRWVAGEVIEVQAGDLREVRGLPALTLPARHWIAPGAPRAQPIGFLIGGERGIWFAGDTGQFPGMLALRGRVELAMLPVWTWGPHLGPGHLGPRSAAEVVAAIGAPHVLPIHWGTLYPRRLHRVWKAPLLEPGDRFAAHVARLAPSAHAHVLRPGEEAVVG